MATTKIQAPSASFANTVIQTEYGNYTVDAAGFTTVDSRAVAALLRAGFLIVDALRTVADSHVTTAGEASANTMTLTTGLTTIVSAIVQVLDAGNNVVTTDADVTFSGGNIIVADGSTYNTVAGQIVKYIACGV